METKTNKSKPRVKKPKKLSNKARIDFLESLVGRHVMTPCFRSKRHPEALRRDPCRSDAHVGDIVSIYIRNSLGLVVAEGRGISWRETIDSAAISFNNLQNKTQ
jgi:hypothetical protein